MASPNTAFTAAYAKAALAAACAFWALVLLAHYFVLFPSGVHAGHPAHAWRAIVRLSMVVGPAGLLACVGLLAAGAALLAWQARKAIGMLRNEMGADALDALRLEQARGKAQKAGLIGSMPAHLQSVTAFRAHRRRLKVLFVLLVGVFACVGLAAAFGLL